MKDWIIKIDYNNEIEDMINRQLETRENIEAIQLTDSEKAEALFEWKKRKYFRNKALNGNVQARAIAASVEEDQALNTISMLKSGLKAINENDLQ